MIIIENNDKQYNTTIQRALDCINKRNGMSEVLKETNENIDLYFIRMYEEISKINSRYGNVKIREDDFNDKLNDCVDDFNQIYHKIPLELVYSISSDMISRDIVESDSILLFDWINHVDFQSCVINTLEIKVPLILEFLNSNPAKEDEDSFVKSKAKEFSLSIEEFICDILIENLSKLSIRLLEQPNGLDFGGYACGGISLNMVDLSLEGLNLSEIYRTLKIFSKLDEAKKNIIKYEPNKRELSKYISGAMDYISKNKNTLKVSGFTELESKMKSFVSLLNS